MRSYKVEAAKAAVRASMLTLIYEVAQMDDQPLFDAIVVLADMDNDGAEIGYTVSLDGVPISGGSL